jgi:ankyrin repeat protein
MYKNSKKRQQKKTRRIKKQKKRVTRKRIGGFDNKKELIELFASSNYDEKNKKINEYIKSGFDINKFSIFKIDNLNSLNSLFYVCNMYCRQNSVATDENVKENIKLLINNKADINFIDNNGDTVVTFCLKTYIECDTKIYKLLEFLIENNADINIKDKENNTPLHLVCLYENVELIKRIIDATKDINSLNSNHESPLLIYCRDAIKFNIDIFNYFVEKNADINISDNLLFVFSHNNNYDGVIEFFNNNKFIYDNDMITHAIEYLKPDNELKTDFENIQKSNIHNLLITKIK